MESLRTVLAIVLGLTAVPDVVALRAGILYPEPVSGRRIHRHQTLLVAEAIISLLLVVAAVGTRSFGRAPLVGMLAALVAALLLLERLTVPRDTLLVVDMARLVIALALAGLSFL